MPQVTPMLNAIKSSMTTQQVRCVLLMDGWIKINLELFGQDFDVSVFLSPHSDIDNSLAGLGRALDPHLVRVWFSGCVQRDAGSGPVGESVWVSWGCAQKGEGADYGLRTCRHRFDLLLLLSSDRVELLQLLSEL